MTCLAQPLGRSKRFLVSSLILASSERILGWSGNGYSTTLGWSGDEWKSVDLQLQVCSLFCVWLKQLSSWSKYESLWSLTEQALVLSIWQTLGTVGRQTSKGITWKCPYSPCTQRCTSLHMPHIMTSYKRLSESTAIVCPLAKVLEKWITETVNHTLLLATPQTCDLGD